MVTTMTRETTTDNMQRLKHDSIMFFLVDLEQTGGMGSGASKEK